VIELEDLTDHHPRQDANLLESLLFDVTNQHLATSTSKALSFSTRGGRKEAQGTFKTLKYD